MSRCSRTVPRIAIQCGEVVLEEGPNGERIALWKIGGHRPRTIVGETASWLRKGLGSGVAFAVRGLVHELEECGTSVNMFTVWTYVREQGFSFTKNSSGRGTGSCGGRAMATVSGGNSGGTPGISG